MDEKESVERKANGKGGEDGQWEKIFYTI